MKVFKVFGKFCAQLVFDKRSNQCNRSKEIFYGYFCILGIFPSTAFPCSMLEKFTSSVSFLGFPHQLSRCEVRGVSSPHKSFLMDLMDEMDECESFIFSIFALFSFFMKSGHFVRNIYRYDFLSLFVN